MIIREGLTDQGIVLNKPIRWCKRRDFIDDIRQKVRGHKDPTDKTASGYKDIADTADRF